MQLIEVEAVEDRSRAEGGHALILLRGIASQPATGKFKVTPVDADAPLPDARSLTEKIFTPLAMSESGGDLALSVGPEITEHPALLPGTAYTIEVVELGVSGVLLWPAITPSVRPKRRNIMTRRIAGDPLPARVGPASSVQPSTVPPNMTGENGTEISEKTRLAAHDDERSHQPPSEQPSSHRKPSRIVAPAKPRAAAPEHDGSNTRAVAAAAPTTSSLVDEKQPPAKPVPDEMTQPEAAEEPVAKGGNAASNSPDPKSLVSTTISAVQNSDTPLAFNAAGAPLTEHLPTNAGGPSHTVVAPKHATIATSSQIASPQAPSDRLTEDPDAIVFPDRSKSERAAPLRAQQPVQPPAASGPARRLSTLSVAAMTGAVLFAGQLALMSILDLSIAKRDLNGQVAAVAKPLAETKPSDHMRAASAGTAQSIYDVIATGPRSPRGASGEGVSATKAIQTAHALLHGPVAQRDPDEAIYWLKRYLSAAIGSENARVALTQLGSAFVEPGRGERDYTSARMAWELASALGDTVSMCFLGAMHEHGLGVQMSPRSASVWYQRAAAAGRSCVTSETEAPTR